MKELYEKNTTIAKRIKKERLEIMQYISKIAVPQGF